jgi:hypothetical protein
MKSLIVALSLILLGGIGCGKSEPPQPKVTTKYHIKITPNGEVFEGDKQLTEEEFAQKLKELKASGAGIVYTRDAVGEANEAEGAVLRAINEAEVPVIFEAKKK